MKPVLLLAFLIAAAAAVPTPTALPVQRQEVPVLYQMNTRDNLGQFAYRYKLGDGTEFNEEGSLRRTEDDKDNVLVKTGSYRYIAPDGTEVRVSYTADEHGFRINHDVPQEHA